MGASIFLTESQTLEMCKWSIPPCPRIPYTPSETRSRPRSDAHLSSPTRRNPVSSACAAVFSAQCWALVLTRVHVFYIERQKTSYELTIFDILTKAALYKPADHVAFHEDPTQLLRALDKGVVKDNVYVSGGALKRSFHKFAHSTKMDELMIKFVNSRLDIVAEVCSGNRQNLKQLLTPQSFPTAIL